MAVKQGTGKIDYLHYTWSPVKGRCGFAQAGKPCPYCWMEAFWKRFSHRKDGSVLWEQKIRLDEKELEWVPRGRQKRIGVCFSTDLFHPLVPVEYIEKVLDHIHANSQHDYLLLTKAGEQLGIFDFPENSWVGVSVDGSIESQASVVFLAALGTHAKFKWISLEPFLTVPYFLLSAFDNLLSVEDIADEIDWVVIGPDSTPGSEPPPDRWINLIVEWARRHNIAVWMKDSLVFSGPRLKQLPKKHTNERDLK